MTPTLRCAILVAGLAFVGGFPSGSAGAPPSPESLAHFETHVRPLLLEKCVSCHGPKQQRGGLRLDARENLLKGGDTGPALVPGQPGKSLLLQAVRKTGDLKMPPKENLPSASVAALELWIQQGAPWPGGGAAPVVSSVAEARKSHWAFRPVRKPALPAVQRKAWVRTPLDAFILTRLEAKGLPPAPEADRRTLIRRAFLDLVGVPPSPEEVQAFVTDPSPRAYEKLIDRLLASPAYGERWGRHWLDVARYADTKGYVFTEERRFPYAYTYRDYIIQAFNEDLPYDRFLIEQLAADQLPLGADHRPLAAMGFLTLGRRFLNNIHDIIDDRIDVTMRGLQGLTVACARCHDHKFDPIPTRDYYSLHGVFQSSVEPAELPLLTAPAESATLAAFNKELAVREGRLRTFRETARTDALRRFKSRTAEYLLAAGASPMPERGAPGKDDLVRPLVQRWRMHLAQARKAHHPVLAPWFLFSELSATEFTRRAPAVAARIAANDAPGKPIDPAVARLFAGKPPASLAEVAQRYADLLAEAEKSPGPDNQKVREALAGPAEVPVGEIDRFLNRAQRNKLTDFRKQIERWKATGPGAPPRAMVLVDAPAPVNPRVLVRGNPNNPGVVVPRQFLEVLSGDQRQPFTKGSGRLELARAIANRDNPLTARVLVNRVWLHHFGQGIVRTPGNFGLRGEPPSHPELLDWLAVEFMERGWSLKNLHRQILLSATYRQASVENPRAASIDPENTLLWRMNRRRLEFEALRDSLLSVAGRLDEQLGGPAVEITLAPWPPRRSVYGFIDRQNLPGLFRTFDLASPDASTPQRHETTVPQQALFLMNSPFVIEQAKALVARPDVVGQKTEAARIDRLYRLAYGRPADQEELALGLAFVRGPVGRASPEKLSPWEQYAQALLLANEFAFVD